MATVEGSCYGHQCHWSWLIPPRGLHLKIYISETFPRYIIIIILTDISLQYSTTTERCTQITFPRYTYIYMPQIFLVNIHKIHFFILSVTYFEYMIMRYLSYFETIYIHISRTNRIMQEKKPECLQLNTPNDKMKTNNYQFSPTNFGIRIWSILSQSSWTRRVLSQTLWSLPTVFSN